MAETKRGYKAKREAWGTITERANGRLQASYMHQGERLSLIHI